ncbi:MAG: hypothetical protein M1541_15200 [Acidobacteria bacterium]|nr:hypothetical protein [Acidobacteriota bacterium]
MQTLTTSYRQYSRLSCAAALSLVFLCGAVVGAVAMNFGHTHLHKAAFWTEPGKTIYLERVKKELDLTPVQTEEMQLILDDFAKYYRNVASDGKSRILQILNDQQKQKFEQMLTESSSAH